MFLWGKPSSAPAHGALSRNTADRRKRGCEVASHPTARAATAPHGTREAPWTACHTLSPPQHERALPAKVLPGAAISDSNTLYYERSEKSPSLSTSGDTSSSPCTAYSSITLRHLSSKGSSSGLLVSPKKPSGLKKEIKK